MTRDTTTGSDFEKIVETCLLRASKENNFVLIPQQNVGTKPGSSSTHRIDWEIVSSEDGDIRGLISCKYQGTSGTAEEKIVYEVIKLLHTMKVDTRYKHSWLVLGGNGWSDSIKQLIASKQLEEWIPSMEGKITIFIDPNDLLARAKEEVRFNS